MNLLVTPDLNEIANLARRHPDGTLLGHAQAAWREKTRLELGLAADRPIIATGHQTLLWHPGILAKYMVMDAVADVHGFGRANLIVDQHVDNFGEFDVPIRRGDGSLAVRRVVLVSPRKDVPMGLQPPFAAPREPLRLPYALKSVERGVQRIFQAVHAYENASNAALQMAMALGELMNRWVKPVTHVTATDLGQTSLSRILLQAMADDPHACAEAYNAAVAQVSEAGIGPLLVRDDYVELPLWRVRPDGRRMRAYDNDVQSSLADSSLPPLLPRALFMTALVRLGMCDVFIHGTGGAKYDRAMELWIRNWLGVEVGNIAVATATLRLPLLEAGSEKATSPGAGEIERAQHHARHIWHDPQAGADSRMPSPHKQVMLDRINAMPWRSPQRKAAFIEMHHELERIRDRNSQAFDRARRELADVMQRAADAQIALRRDWPFALYPDAMLDELAAAVHNSAATTARAGN